MSGAYLRTRIVDISFAIYAPSWLVSVRLGRVYLVYNGLNGGRPAAAPPAKPSRRSRCQPPPVESVLTGSPDRPRPGSMVTVNGRTGNAAKNSIIRLGAYIEFYYDLLYHNGILCFLEPNMSQFYHIDGVFPGRHWSSLVIIGRHRLSLAVIGFQTYPLPRHNVTAGGTPPLAGY